MYIYICIYMYIYIYIQVLIFTILIFSRMLSVVGLAHDCICSVCCCLEVIMCILRAVLALLIPQALVCLVSGSLPLAL